MKTLVWTVSFLFSLTVFGQESGSIVGKIMDHEQIDEPMLFAEVSLKGTHWKTQTNFNGNFELLDVVPGNYLLAISFLGYEDLEIPVEVHSKSILQIEESLMAKGIYAEEAIQTADGSASNDLFPAPTLEVTSQDQ